MAHANAELAARAYSAFAAGDAATLTELIADDVQWTVAGDGPLSGTYQGRDAVFGFFAAIRDRADRFTLEIDELLATDRRAVAIVDIDAARQGRTLTGQAVHVMDISDGQVTRFWSGAFDQAALDAFWA